MSSETTNKVEIVTGTSKDNRKSEVFEVRLAGSTRLLSVTDSSKCEHHLFVDYYITSNRQPLFTRVIVHFLVDGAILYAWSTFWNTRQDWLYPGLSPRRIVWLIQYIPCEKECDLKLFRTVSFIISTGLFTVIRHHLWLYRCLFRRPTTAPHPQPQPSSNSYECYRWPVPPFNLSCRKHGIQDPKYVF